MSTHLMMTMKLQTFIYKPALTSIITRFNRQPPQNNKQQPHPSQTINPGPSNLVPTANISDIEFLDDDFELEVQSQNWQLNRILKEIDDDLKDKSTTDFNPLNFMNPLTNIQTDQTINEQNLADIPTSILTMQNSKFKSRFIINNEEERKSFLDDRANQNTKRKMMYSVNTFKQFLNDIKSETRDIYTIQPTELDTYLQFFIGIRKQTKNENEESEYQPGTLSGFHGMINRYSSSNGYIHDIMKDLTIKKSRDCLMAKKKHLKELGLGNLPNAAEAIESDEEEELFSSGAFGTENSDSLLAAIWYLNTIHFGLQGSHEHRQLNWG
ncbi:unnamed protein product [Mytilus coruscus]|uniref:DUF3504 domain-containing protein n=1 Tax=Mytilus coruscus TaxID=42192 RepID=A0A6J8C9A9_MYTCO|nr:unnamed protein product [Mytilus coruscus]